MYKYSTDGQSVIRLSDNAVIPVNATNKDYLHIVAWVEQGNIIALADTPPAQPITLTRRQFFIALCAHGYLTPQEAAQSAIPLGVQSYFDTLPNAQKTAATITWYQMTAIPQDDPMVALLAGVLDMTAEQLRDFFVEAAQY